MIPKPQIRGLSEWRPLARGGLAMVWQARDVSSGRQVAVKVYHRGLHEDDPRQFLGEAAATRRLAAHPGFVTTYSVGLLPDARPYIVMELCPGGSLTRWLEAEHRPSEERVRQVGLQVADTLAAAHAAGVLHRDIKPANILIDSAGKARLADLGLAIERGAEADPPDGRWMTPAWAPPEAFRLQPATEAGDVFSLAATLYALLAGRPPRAGGDADTPLEELAEIAKQPIAPIPGVSRPLMDVLLAALDDDPAARPSAATFFDQLARVPLRTSKRGAVVGAAAAASATGFRGTSRVIEHPGPSKEHQDAAAAVAPRPRRTAPPPARAAEAPGRPGNRRAGFLVLVAALAVLIVSAATLLLRGPASSGAGTPVTQGPVADAPPSSADPPPTSAPTPTPTTTESPGDGGASAPPGAKSIQLVEPVDAAQPFRPARISGTYPGGSETLLRVQRWEEGAWVTFPVPTRTDRSGRFTAYVELGQPGRYRLRVLDPDSGVTSKPIVLVVKG